MVASCKDAVNVLSAKSIYMSKGGLRFTITETKLAVGAMATSVQITTFSHSESVVPTSSNLANELAKEISNELGTTTVAGAFVAQLTVRAIAEAVQAASLRYNQGVVAASSNRSYLDVFFHVLV